MLDHLGWGEMLVIIVVALFVFGPERLPQVAGDAARMLRKLRELAQGATADLKSELGPEMADLDLTSLHPKTFVRKHLFEDGADPVRAVPAAVQPAAPLAENERPPFDPDAT